MTSKDEAEKQEIVNLMFEDLKVEHGDVEWLKINDEFWASIPYFSHGRMQSHLIDLNAMADSALVVSRQFNARLIADLLEALKAIATGRDKDGMKVDFPQDIALAAIAKATE